MAATVAHQAGRSFGTATSSWVRRLVLLCAVIVGLVAMHHLGGVTGQGGHHHSGTLATGHCPAHGDCPGTPHGHPGSVCQARLPVNGHSPGVPAPVPLLGALPAPHLAVSFGAAAVAATHGTGCGPPQLTVLSRFRI